MINLNTEHLKRCIQTLQYSLVLLPAFIADVSNLETILHQRFGQEQDNA